LLFSVYYKIEHRFEYLDRFFDKNQFDPCTEERLEDLMELLVKMILDQDKDGLLIMLTRSGMKNARTFFNYLTCSCIRNTNRDAISRRLNELLDEG